MKKVLEAAALTALLALAQTALATPSTTFWTPATIYSQPYLVPHLTYDTYVTEKGLIAPDYGLTIGILPFEKLQAEVGVDLFMPGTPGTYVKDNLYLNAKLTVPEGAFGELAPGLSAGVQSVGFKKDYSDYDHFYLNVGKTFPVVGNITVGGYHGGNKNLYLSSTGKEEQSGFQASWTSPDINVKVTGLDKIVVMADYASGKNAFGAFGAGIGFFFTPAIDVLTGPIFVNDKNNGAFGGNSMFWTVQLDVDFDLRPPAPPAAPAAK
jgi:hypothetical protein